MNKPSVVYYPSGTRLELDYVADTIFQVKISLFESAEPVLKQAEALNDAREVTN